MRAGPGDAPSEVADALAVTGDAVRILEELLSPDPFEGASGWSRMGELTID